MRAVLEKYRSNIYSTRYPIVAPPFVETAGNGIYPNPISDQIRVHLKNVETESVYRLEIINSIGQVTHKITLESKNDQTINKTFGLTGMHFCIVYKNDTQQSLQRVFFLR